MVSCCYYNDIGVGIKVVYFSQNLVEGVFLFIVGLYSCIFVLGVANGIDFINKNDIGGGLFGFFEKVMDF